MSPMSVAQAFREGRILGPGGPLPGRSALLTRRSLLMFTDNSVLKLRRAVNVGGVDLTTRPLRLYSAERELFSGRLLAPDAYLADCSLMQTEAGYTLIPVVAQGEPLVAMWRQPLDLRCDRLVLGGGVSAERLHPLVNAVAAFHEAAPLERNHVGYGAPGRVRARWKEIVGALSATTDADVGGAPAPLSADALAALDQQTLAWLDRLDGTLVHRVTEGRVRDLHLALRLEHIYLTDPVVVLDPDERPEAYHWSDTAEDVAMFAVELDALGYPDVAAAALDYYAGLTYDRTLRWVTPLFKRLVALRRAADLWQEAREAPAEAGPELFARARMYAELAQQVVEV